MEELLCHDPCTRLGSTAMGGINGVKEHCFFDEIDWRALLRQKAEFVPQLQGEEDTSYFDSECHKCQGEQKGAIYEDEICTILVPFPMK